MSEPFITEIQFEMAPPDDFELRADAEAFDVSEIGAADPPEDRIVPPVPDRTVDGTDVAAADRSRGRSSADELNLSLEIVRLAGVWVDLESTDADDADRGSTVDSVEDTESNVDQILPYMLSFGGRTDSRIGTYRHRRF